MKTMLIYFSQTGNTEAIAKAIQKGVIEVTGQCDIGAIHDVDPAKLGDYDLIGLGSPVMGAEPGNVSDYVAQMKFVGGKHIFLFYTHGTSEGIFWPSIYPKLKARGLEVIGKADWYGDCHLLHMPQPYPTAGHPDEIDFETAEAYGREMAVRSGRVRQGHTELIPEAPEPLPAPRPPKEGVRGFAEIIGSFGDLLKYDKEKCIYPDCTLCMDNCPTYGNDITVDPVVLGKPCIGCEFCARICPTGALDMTDWIADMIEMTKEHLPGMLVKLEKAEAEGRFRRKVKVEDINLDDPGINQFKNHPQYIIGKGPQK